MVGLALKTCTRCRAEKTVDDFYRASPVNRAAGREYQSQCKTCVRENRVARRATAHGKDYALGYRLRADFGLSLEDYAQMAEQQGYCCAVCGRPETATRSGIVKRLAVDHDHATGRVRALLCSRCNTAIGLLRDDPSLARRVADYLE